LRLSETELSAALAGLNPAERLELLRLLEVRAAAEADQVPDERKPLSTLAEEALQEAAARSGDPAAFLEAHRQHAERRELHLPRLLPALSETADIKAYLAEFWQAWVRAGELAAADGFPKPESRSLAPKPPVAEPSPAPRLPRDVEADVAQTRARESGAPHASTASPMVPRQDSERWWSGRDDGLTPRLYRDGI
jgi:hypothetical protein